MSFRPKCHWNSRSVHHATYILEFHYISTIIQLLRNDHASTVCRPDGICSRLRRGIVLENFTKKPNKKCEDAYHHTILARNTWELQLVCLDFEIGKGIRRVDLFVEPVPCWQFWYWRYWQFQVVFSNAGTIHSFEWKKTNFFVLSVEQAIWAMSRLYVCMYIIDLSGRDIEMVG